jgi:hypothetical protein
LAGWPLPLPIFRAGLKFGRGFLYPSRRSMNGGQ